MDDYGFYFCVNADLIFTYAKLFRGFINMYEV